MGGYRGVEEVYSIEEEEKRGAGMIGVEYIGSNVCMCVRCEREEGGGSEYTV